MTPITPAQVWSKPRIRDFIDQHQDAFGGLYVNEDSRVPHVNTITSGTNRSASRQMRTGMTVVGGPGDAAAETWTIETHEVRHSMADLRAVMTVGLGGVRHNDFAGERHLNLYYCFRPSVWGRGYAPEMARAAMAWAAQALPGMAVRIVTTAENAAACRVAEKLGFIQIRQAADAGPWTRIYQWRGSGVGTSGATNATSESSTSSA